MKKQTKFCLIILLVVLVVFACSNEENPVNTVETGSDGLIPLKIGNSWTYQATIYDLDSNITFEGTYLQEVFASFVSDNLTWYYIDKEPEAEQYPRYTNKEDGYYELYNKNEIGKLMFKYPCNKGDNYIFNGPTIRVSSIDTNITTTLGNFNCILYRRQVFDYNAPPQYIVTEWYISPEIGVIRTYSFHPSYGTNNYELLSYNLE